MDSSAKNQENKLKKLEQEVENNNKRFLNLDEITVEKQTKNGSKMVDIRPSILDISVKKFKKSILELGLNLKIGQQGNLNPRYVAKAWISNFPNNFDIIRICRNGLYVKGEEVI